ncbi:unnamed protein product [Prorocentrum cordatum]|uniref:Tyrosine specific protein phosphatases domain-containing protein n=1 Tax=Prorocentrum cordatum TaxID=2364126 RepID=A0ABN9RNX5_9DINO|nr:unnamed protein product [Polarella glacialis]
MPDLILVAPSAPPRLLPAPSSWPSAVHCLAGAHRAGTTGVAYTMHAADLDHKTAIAACKACRPIVDPIGDLTSLLATLEREREAAKASAKRLACFAAWSREAADEERPLGSPRRSGPPRSPPTGRRRRPPAPAEGASAAGREGAEGDLVPTLVALALGDRFGWARAGLCRAWGFR